MKKTTKQSIVLYSILAVLSAIFLLLGNTLFAQSQTAASELYRAKVISVDNISFSFTDYAEETIVNETVAFTAKIVSGKWRGEIITATQYVDNIYPDTPNAVEAGSNVILNHTDIGGDSAEFIFSQYNRISPILVLFLFFSALLLIIAKKSGISIIVSLIITGLAIFSVYLPAILSGANIYVTTIVIALFITVVSLIFVGGFKIKSLAAIIGTTGGVILSGLLAVIFSKILAITGMLNEDYFFLVFLLEGKPLDLRAVVWSGIVIGSLGAVMDVAMSISSAMNEVAENIKEPAINNLFRIGMNIGRDAIGTMTNTLVLAYIGSSLATILLLTAYNNDPLYILNLETIVAEIMQAIVGSIGILFAVPVTAMISSFLFQDRKQASNTI